MRRSAKGRPIVLVIVASVMLGLNVAGWWICRTTADRLAVKVRAAERVFLAGSHTASTDEEPIPDRNRPQGQLSGLTGWLAFYRDLEGSARSGLPCTVGIFLFSLLFVRDRRTG